MLPSRTFPADADTDPAFHRKLTLNEYNCYSSKTVWKQCEVHVNRSKASKLLLHCVWVTSSSGLVCRSCVMASQSLHIEAVQATIPTTLGRRQEFHASDTPAIVCFNVRRMVSGRILSVSTIHGGAPKPAQAHRPAHVGFARLTAARSLPVPARAPGACGGARAARRVPHRAAATQHGRRGRRDSLRRYSGAECGAEEGIARRTPLGQPRHGTEGPGVGRGIGVGPYSTASGRGQR